MNGSNDTTDYRAKLEREMAPSLGGWIGPRRIRELLDGYAAQVIETHRKSVTGVPTGDVLRDALVKGLGYTREAADQTVGGFVQDAEAYRMLADAVVHVIRAEDDINDWDGDDSEVSSLMTFVEWLPDMIRHRASEALRERSGTDADPTFGALEAVADAVDPFGRKPAGQWVRKSDGAPVPWPVVKE